MKKILLLLLLSALSNLVAQNQTKIIDSTKTDSTKIDTMLFVQNDTLGLKLSYPQTNIPKNFFAMPKPPVTPLDIDMRESSYYTPRNVQDKMDRIMNRPRSDSFMPILAMAAFAASVAAKQLQVEKLFELNAEDYLIPEKEFEVLEKLWIKAPQSIDELYLKSDLQNEQTAKLLQEKVASLSEKSLLKTRGDGENNILFFPAQKLEKVKELFKTALSDFDNSEEEIKQLKIFYDKLYSIHVDVTK